jgi:cytochrome c-type biogenesis protein CcmH/NrfG
MKSIRVAILASMSAVFLFVACSRSAAARDASWIHVSSPHFNVYSNASEGDARRIAAQFEEIRAVFLSDFPGLHVDAGRPLIVIAVRDENSLKVLLPDYWTGKDRSHPVGLHQSGTDEDFAILRTDINSNSANPYTAIYYEYTSEVLRLNYSNLPFWLRYGLSDFYSNTIVESQQTRVGVANASMISTLRNTPLIPIDKLMFADDRSPYINEQQYAYLFHAESWALVHYLEFDKDAAKQQLLTKYLLAWSKSQDSEAAAKEVFGDLSGLQLRLQDYAHQAAFYQEVRKPVSAVSAKDFAVQPMSEAAALVVQADALQHRNHAPEANEMLKRALTLEPSLAGVHTCLGFAAFLKFDNDEATKEFTQANTLDPKDFRPLYYLALIVLRQQNYSAQSTPQMDAYLEKVVQQNPNFAPAYAFLSVAYRHQPVALDKALNAALRANQLEPANLAYAVDVGDVLIALNRDSEARELKDKLTKVAISAQEKSELQAYANRLASYESKTVTTSPDDQSPASTQ